MFQDKLILVTGADGFIGSHLTEALLAEGAKVRALSQYNSFNDWGWLETLPESDRLEVVCGDIRDPFFCREICKGANLVFHLAALIAIPYSYTAPMSYVDTNVQGTVNICKAALEEGVERIVHTSTSEVYGTARYVPIDEKHPLQPQSPYSASKISADAMAMSFYYSFELPLTIARPFNTYGPRQSARAVIPTIITQLAAGKKEIQMGDGSPTRDFNYVKDTAAAFIELARTGETIGEVCNIGSGREMSIQNLTEMICELMNTDAKIRVDEKRLRPAGSEVHRLLADSSKIRKMTNWKPRYTLEQGIRESIDWFTNKTNLSRYKTDIYNI